MRVKFFNTTDGVVGFQYGDSQTYYYRKNLQGDIIALVDASGNVVAKYHYDAWGNHKVYYWHESTQTFQEANESINLQNCKIALFNPFRYRSYYYDTETGFYYVNGRYYDPTICRFVSASNVDEFFANGANIDRYGFYADKLKDVGFSVSDLVASTAAIGTYVKSMDYDYKLVLRAYPLTEAIENFFKVTNYARMFPEGAVHYMSLKDTGLKGKEFGKQFREAYKGKSFSKGYNRFLKGIDILSTAVDVVTAYSQTQNEEYAAFTFVYSLATGWVTSTVAPMIGAAIGSLFAGGAAVAVAVVVTIVVAILLTELFKLVDDFFWELGNML